MTWRTPPFRLRGFSIRARLGVLIVTAFLPVLIMAALIARQNYRNELAQATQAALLTRSAAVARADTDIGLLRNVLVTLSGRLPPAITAENCHTQLQEAYSLREPDLAVLAFVGPNGKTVCAVGNPSRMTALPDGATLFPQWGTKQASGRFELGQVIDLSGQQVLLGSFPVIENGTLRGGLVGGLLLRDLLPPNDVHGHSFYTWLMRGDGELFPIGVPSNVPRPQQETLHILSKSDAGTEPEDVNGGAFTYAAGELDGDYRMLVAYPALSIAHHAHALMVRQVSQIALLALLGFLAVTFGANRAIVRPLKQLTCEVMNWRRTGMFNAQPLWDAPTELRELTKSFRDATDWLTERELQLQGAAAQQELLMQEIHHRVKNNLQIVASLLNLQASRIRLPEAKAEFQSARDRVRALATLHRHLYAHGEVHTINMRGFLMELCEQLFQAMGERAGERIQLDIEASEIEMSSDQAVPLALIVTEAVSNAVKYAFPDGRRGHVMVRLTNDGPLAKLVIQDDGVGMSSDRIEPGTRDGLGLQLIRGFARQLHATLTVDEGDGTRYQVLLPLRRDRAEQPEPV